MSNSRYNFDDYFDAADVELQEYIEEGNLSSLTKQMISFFDDRAEYERQYGPIYGPDAMEIEKNYRWSKYLPETVNELKRIERQVENRRLDQPGYCKLGTVDLSIPPIQISVNDIKNNYTYQTLRTNSDMTFVSGHTSKIIEMDVYFNGIDDINNKLIPLLAQLRATPFIPIYNDYIRATILPESKDINFVDDEEKDSTVAQAILDTESRKRSSIEALLSSARNVSPEMAHDVSKYFYGSEDAYNYNSFSGTKSLTENIKYAQVEYYATPEGMRAFNQKDPYVIGAVKGLTEQAEETEKELLHLRELYADQFSKMEINNKSTGILAGVLSQMTVSTVPGFPESLICHFTFFVFNYAPFSQKFDFIRWDNTPTNDIDECEYFIKWYSDRFLSNSSSTSLKRLSKELDGSVKIKFEVTPTDETGKVKEGDKRNYFFMETDDNNVCSSITVSNKNNIAFMPVLAWSTPTCQYLGRSSSEILLTFDVLEDEFLEKIKFISEVIDLVARTNTDKGRRKNFVSIDNEVLKLNGIRDCIIQSVDSGTVPGQPGMTRINVKLIEFNKNQLETELIIMSEGATSERMMALYDNDFDNILRTREENGDNSPKQTESFPVHDALNESLLIYEGDNSKGKTLTALADPIAMRGLKSTAAAEGDIKIANKVANGFDLYFRAKPGQIKSNAQEITSGLVQRTILSTALSGAGRIAEFLAPKKTIKEFSVGEQEDRGYFFSVKKIKNGEIVDYPVKERKFLRDKIENKMYGIAATDDSPAIPPQKITDEAKTAQINTEAMREWREKKEKQIINYLEGRIPNNSDEALSNQEAEVLRERGLDKYQNKSHVVYPDLELPVYGDLPLLEKPSYDTLGIVPPGEIARDLSPRQSADIVEPDFYFNNLKLKKYKGSVETWEKPKTLSWEEIRNNTIKDVSRSFKKIKDSAKKLMEDEKTYAGDKYWKAENSTLEDVDDTNLQMTYAKQQERERISRQQQESSDILEGVGLQVVNDGEEYGIYGNITSHTNAMDKTEAKNYDINSEYHAQQLRTNIVDSIKDDTKRMVRAFPTFRLYFIEEDAESWGLFDDFYGYNSIESIEIHKSKENAADTAVIKVTNFLGHLDNKNFESDKHGRGAKERYNLETGKMEDPQIEDMYLYPGTRIQIKLGHSSNESELSNVFTGKITEVQHGDVVTFVAQGYGIELLHPKGYDWNKSKYGGFPFAWRADPLNIMNMLVNSTEVKHFGRWGFSNLEEGEILGWRVKGKWVPYWNRPQDDNIYLQRKNRSNRFIRAFGFANEYRIYQRTAWDVFQDMRRRFPGYAVAAVPYDGRATLFFGLPNQLYNFTSGNKGSSVRTDVKRFLEDQEKLELSTYKPMLKNDNTMSFKIKDPDNPNSDAIRKVWNRAAKQIHSGEEGVTYITPGEFDEKDVEALARTADKLVGDDNQRNVYDSNAADERLTSSYKFKDFFIKKLNEDPKNIDLFKISTSDEVRSTSDDSSYYSVVISPGEDTIKTSSGGSESKNNKLWVNDVGDVITEEELNEMYPLATGADPRYKVFRDYHFKDSFHHICANNIKIDLQNFYNRIVVEFYGDIDGRNIIEQKKASRNYFELLADDSIPPDYWKTKVVFEENAERYYQARNYALGNILQTTSKLYGGDLVILGDANIKPYDIVYINDTYTNMYGPVEVSEVVHRLTRETGFVTTIIPELVVHVNNPQSISDTWLAQGMALGMTGIAAAAVTAAVMSGVVATIAIGSVLMIPSVRDTIFPTIFGKLGFSASVREPIGVTPLVYNGKPYIAGFEGMRHESYIVALGDRIAKYLEELDAGISIASFMITNSRRGE